MAKAGLSKAFQTALARPVLNRLATIPVFQQGQEIFLRGNLQALVAAMDGASANVQDGEVYHARLWMDDGFLQYECNCTRGQEGFLCAHGVAVALAAMERRSAAKSKDQGKTIDLAETGRILREQSSETLAGMLLTWSQRDDRLLQHLLTFAAQQGGYAIDVRSYRASLRRRLKPPNMYSTITEVKKFAKAVSAEMDEIATFTANGQAFAAMELSAAIVLLLLNAQGRGEGHAPVRQELVRAYQVFVRAARQTKAELKTLVPQQLKFHALGIDEQLDEAGDTSGLSEMTELLGEEGRRALAQAAEEKINRKTTDWEKRIESRRMEELAEIVYLSLRDFDSMERLIFESGEQDFSEVLDFARVLLQMGVPDRARGLMERAEATYRGKPPREWYWMMAEAQLQLGEREAAFIGLQPLLGQRSTAEFEALHQFAVDHQCWPEWREYLMSEAPPGRPAAALRPHWRFQVFILEKNYADAWTLAAWHPVDPTLAGRCALEMREAEPVEAARVLVTSAETLLRDERIYAGALVFLDAAAQMVIDQAARPENLAQLLAGTYRRFDIYGMSHLVKPRQALWYKAMDLLKVPTLSVVPGRRR